MSVPKNQEQSCKPMIDSRRGQYHYVSNLRSSLTALVIFHHTALCYGGLGSTVYRSALIRPASSTTLVGLNVFNQSFFMGTFMYLGGHFSAKAIARRSAFQFIKDRCYRLGLPAVLYTLCVHPISYAVMAIAHKRRYGLVELQQYWSALKGLRGPVWFLGTLFVFDTALACYKSLAPGHGTGNLSGSSSTNKPPRTPTVSLLSSLTASSATDFFWRMSFGTNCSFQLLSLNLGYFPQYLAAYVLGAQSTDLLASVAEPGVAACLALVSLASGSILAHEAVQRPPVLFSLMVGGNNRLSLAYSVFNYFTGFLVGGSLLKLYSRCANRPWAWINEHAYTAFLVHMPVSVLVEVFAEAWDVQPVLKTAAVGTVNAVASWGFAFVGDQLYDAAARLCLACPPGNHQAADYMSQGTKSDGVRNESSAAK